MINLGDTQRKRFCMDPALSLVPEARAPPKGCCPSTGPVCWFRRSGVYCVVIRGACPCIPSQATPPVVNCRCCNAVASSWVAPCGKVDTGTFVACTGRPRSPCKFIGRRSCSLTSGPLLWHGPVSLTRACTSARARAPRLPIEPTPWLFFHRISLFLFVF